MGFEDVKCMGTHQVQALRGGPTEYQDIEVPKVKPPGYFGTVACLSLSINDGNRDPLVMTTQNFSD